jgi:hypothetical protein
VGYVLYPQRVVQPARLRGEFGEGVEKLGLEGSAFLRSSGGDFSRPAKVG